MLHIRNFALIFLTGFVTALPVDTYLGGPGLGAEPVCGTVSPRSFVSKITMSVSGLTRGILGDYRAPKAARRGDLVGNFVGGVSHLVDSILGRPETACAPATPIPIPVPAPILPLGSRTD